MPSIGELLGFFKMMEDKSGGNLIRPLYKTLGIALVTRIGGDLCRDAGESALASALDAAGSVCALLVALPLLTDVMNILLALME